MGNVCTAPTGSMARFRLSRRWSAPSNTPLSFLSQNGNGNILTMLCSGSPANPLSTARTTTANFRNTVSMGKSTVESFFVTQEYLRVSGDGSVVTVPLTTLNEKRNPRTNPLGDSPHQRRCALLTPVPTVPSG